MEWGKIKIGEPKYPNEKRKPQLFFFLRILILIFFSGKPIEKRNKELILMVYVNGS